jgi:hypothetical protein
VEGGKEGRREGGKEGGGRREEGGREEGGREEGDGRWKEGRREEGGRKEGRREGGRGECEGVCVLTKYLGGHLCVLKRPWNLSAGDPLTTWGCWSDGLWHLRAR